MVIEQTYSIFRLPYLRKFREDVYKSKRIGEEYLNNNNQKEK
jgi:hypothetical protein